MIDQVLDRYVRGGISLWRGCMPGRCVTIRARSAYARGTDEFSTRQLVGDADVICRGPIWAS